VTQPGIDQPHRLIAAKSSRHAGQKRLRSGCKGVPRSRFHKRCQQVPDFIYESIPVMVHAMLRLAPVMVIRWSSARLTNREFSCALTLPGFIKKETNINQFLPFRRKTLPLAGTIVSCVALRGIDAAWRGFGVHNPRILMRARKVVHLKWPRTYSITPILLPLRREESQSVVMTLISRSGTSIVLFPVNIYRAWKMHTPNDILPSQSNPRYRFISNTPSLSFFFCHSSISG
jgi:hypothetical protein